MPYKFTVNGKSRTVDVPADMPLLWVLRDVLDLQGTKFGCGVAQCGACTVHIAGAPARSCQTPVASVAGKSVTTIEGLSPEMTHPLQRAWIELDVPHRRLSLLIPDDELARRRAAWQPRPDGVTGGYLRLYLDHVLQANDGVDFDILRGRRAVLDEETARGFRLA